nr:hypothetical protein Itr_chr12CG11580 [Ipomoea trifida]
MEQESSILGVTRQPNAVTFKSPSNKLCIPVAGEQKAPSIPLLEAQFMLRPSIQITKGLKMPFFDRVITTCGAGTGGEGNTGDRGDIIGEVGGRLWRGVDVVFW